MSEDAGLAAPRLVPIGSLRADPTNPRKISKERFDALKKSIEEDPKFMELRPILADQDGLIYAGRMRYEACVELGREVVPAHITRIDAAIARRRRLIDNNSYGEWDEDKLAEEVFALRDEGVDLRTLGFDEKDIARLLEVSGANGEQPERPPKTVVCPNCATEFTPA